MLIITNFEQALCMCLKILFMYQKKKEKEDHLKKKKNPLWNIILGQNK